MRFALPSMFSQQASPIVADFGSSSVKLLQVSSGEKPTVTALAEIVVPDELRGGALDRRFEHFATEFPKVFSEAGFRGRRIVLSPSGGQMLIQHMQVTGTDPYTVNEQIKSQLQNQLGVAPGNVVIRSVAVGEFMREGTAKSEHIVFAIARDDVMRYVELFKRLRIQVVGVHDEIQAMLHAFDHLHRRGDDAKVNTLYVDLGWGSTKVAIAHGSNLAFAKRVAIGGRHFDQVVAQALKCDLTAARARRMSEDLMPLRQAPATTQQAAKEGEGGLAMLRAGMAQATTDARLEEVRSPSAAATDERRSGGTGKALGNAIPNGHGPLRSQINFTDQVEGLSDELSMCVRYHQATFPDRHIDRLVFLGGEARQIGLCQFLAESLRLPARAGDPLARLVGERKPAGLPDPEQAHPAWAVACGLAASPTDL
jgi:Tfp pilus assembly PilM family ATPase